MSKEPTTAETQRKVYQLIEEVIELKRQKKAANKDYGDQIKDREDEIKHIINNSSESTVSVSEE